MITSRTRAVVLLLATFVVGGAVGGLVATSKWRADREQEGNNRRRGGWPGMYWLREHNPDSALVARLDSVWVINVCVTDSIQKARIGAQTESVMMSFRPVLDSLRQINRAGIRALLPDSVVAQYDSLNAADDSSRTRQWAQRNKSGGPCSEAWSRWNSRDTRGGPPGSGRGGRGPN